MARPPLGSDPFLQTLLQRCTFPPSGTAVTCGVSGGADSSALAALAVAAGCRTTLIHVDHGLREGSAAEARTVEALASRLGANFESVVVVVDDGPNLEERARLARRNALPNDALLGHTADDQAETVLMFLMRGAGLRGSAGMDPNRHPILGLRRQETVALCDHLDLEVVTDPSNFDDRFTRNRVRADLVPLMTEITGRDVVPNIVRFAQHQREALQVIEELSDTCDPTVASELNSVALPVATEALRRWWRATTGSPHSPDAAAIRRIRAVANGDCVATDVAEGWEVRRSKGKLMLRYRGTAPAVPTSIVADGTKQGRER
jgi:tRNA(Ile)-lysidine synthase